MSSGIEGLGVIALVLPATVATAAVATTALGAGWLAWQSGKLLVDANRTVNRKVADKKRQLEEAARHRRLAAISAHGQLADMCSQILAQLAEINVAGSAADLSEIDQLKHELTAVCRESLPDDTAQIESITSLGYLRLDKVIRRQRQIMAMTLSESERGLYRGLSVADLMDNLRIAVGTMEVHATKGGDVAAVDPDVLERIKLNEKLSAVAAEIMEALEFVETLSSTYGLTASGNVWFQSCFNGTDVQIEELCRPTTSNKELKRGIARLRESVERYEMMAPRIESELRQMAALYKVYIDAAKALGERTVSLTSFENSAELEAELRRLQKRAEKAQECAEIYRKLGPEAYMCYAWDQELKAIGYEVHTRKAIAEMAGKKPVHAEIEDGKLPFYQWQDEELTQLYSIASECSLQVIVHADGTVSMQTISEAVNEDTVQVQKSHCAQLKALHERLRENWFILYDFEETESPEEVTTVSQWREADGNPWKTSDGAVAADYKTRKKETGKTQYMK